MVQITRIYTTEDGESNFDGLIKDGIEFRNHVSYSRVISAHELAFGVAGVQRENEPDLGDWHVAPRCQYVLFKKSRTRSQSWR